MQEPFILHKHSNNEGDSNSFLTKYVVGANANPPKNDRRPPKKGKVMPINIVNAATKER